MRPDQLSSAGFGWLAAPAGARVKPPRTSVTTTAERASRVVFTRPPFVWPAPVEAARRRPQLSPIGAPGGGRSIAAFGNVRAPGAEGVHQGADQAVDRVLGGHDVDGEAGGPGGVGRDPSDAG